MLANLLRFGELKVADVMVPRADIMAVDETIGWPNCSSCSAKRSIRACRCFARRSTIPPAWSM